MREGAFVALAINLLMVIAAIVSIMLTIPKRKPGEGPIETQAEVATADPRAEQPPSSTDDRSTI